MLSSRFLTKVIVVGGEVTQVARRYTRRELLIDASFACGSCILLKVLAPAKEAVAEVSVVKPPLAVENQGS